MIFDRHAKLALVISCVTLLTCGVGLRYAVRALNIYLRKEPVKLREVFSTLPTVIGEWRQVGEDVRYDASMLEALGTHDTLSRAYARAGDGTRSLNVHVAYYTGMIDAVPHIPDRCLVAAGFEQQTLPEVLPLALDQRDWFEDRGPPNLAKKESYKLVNRMDPIDGRAVEVRMPVGDMEIRVAQYGRKDMPNARMYGGFLFIANGCVTAHPEAVRLLAFMPSERFAYYCKLQFIAVGGASFTREEYVSLVSDFLDGFLPEVMRRLPDWQEVERRPAQ